MLFKKKTKNNSIVEFNSQQEKIKGKNIFERADDQVLVENKEELLEGISTYRQMNLPLFIIVICLICFGLVLLFSASMPVGYMRFSSTGGGLHFIIKQTKFIGFGALICFVIGYCTPLKFLKSLYLAGFVYLVTTGLLIYVALAGHMEQNARRWISIFGIKFQPSEIAKVAVVYVLAIYFTWIKIRKKQKIERGERVYKNFLRETLLEFFIPAGLMLFWFFLIVRQPHVSGAFIFSLITFLIFLMAKISLKIWAVGIAVVLVGAALLLTTYFMLPAGKNKSAGTSEPQAVGQEVVKENDNFAHAKKRLRIFFHPEEVSEDDSYQIRQGLIALGSGGLRGVGIGLGRQKFNYLPEAHNDYIFNTIGEEMGFIGTISILILFMGFTFFGLRIAQKTNKRYPFSAMIATGYTALIALQALLNIAVATKTIPATGISLPFFSYGGSSNIIFLIAVGMILCVSKRDQEQKLFIRKSVKSARMHQQQNKSDVRKKRRANAYRGRQAKDEHLRGRHE